MVWKHQNLDYDLLDQLIPYFLWWKTISYERLLQLSPFNCVHVCTGIIYMYMYNQHSRVTLSNWGEKFSPYHDGYMLI